MHRNVIILGLVSLCTDVSSEMLYPLIPLYVTAVLGASPAILGLIEGVAESLASLLKLFSGRVADRFARRKPLAILGYGLSAVAKVFFIVATTWTGILWGRVSDRFGKGIRTAPRDALIADASSAVACYRTRGQRLRGKQRTRYKDGDCRIDCFFHDSRQRAYLHGGRTLHPAACGLP